MTRDPTELENVATAGLADRVAASLRVLDDAFSTSARRLGASVPCGRGCSACCVAVFDIHPADALLLGRWLDGVPLEMRSDVLGRAEAVVARAREVVASEPPGGSLVGWSPEDGLAPLPDHAIEHLAQEIAMSCPVLGPDGECLAYDSRPAICRLQGLPWADATSGAILPDLCRLDERQASNPPQPLDFTSLDGSRWEVRDQFADQLGGSLPRGRSLVAEALIRWAAAGK